MLQKSFFKDGGVFSQNCEREVISYLSRKFQGKVSKLEILSKEDLDLVRVLTVPKSIAVFHIT